MLPFLSLAEGSVNPFYIQNIPREDRVQESQFLIREAGLVLSGPRVFAFSMLSRSGSISTCLFRVNMFSSRGRRIRPSPPSITRRSPSAMLAPPDLERSSVQRPLFQDRDSRDHAFSGLPAGVHVKLP